MISDVINEFHSEILDTALESVCSAFGVTKEDIVSGSRKQHIVYARHAYCALMVHEYNVGQRRVYLHGIPVSSIGCKINRDHSTVIYSAHTSHKNHMDGRNDKYIVYYYRAREAFSSMVDIHSKKDIARRLSEINRQRALLDQEAKDLMNNVETT